MRVSGVREVVHGLEEMSKVIEEYPVSKELAALMRHYAHIRTGYLRNSIYAKHNIAGATAPYAGVQEDRNQFATKAIRAWREEPYADKIEDAF